MRSYDVFESQQSDLTFWVQSCARTLRVIEVCTDNRGHSRQEVCFPAAPVILTLAIQVYASGMSEGNRKSRSKSLCLCYFFLFCLGPPKPQNLVGGKFDISATNRVINSEEFWEKFWWVILHGKYSENAQNTSPNFLPTFSPNSSPSLSPDSEICRRNFALGSAKHNFSSLSFMSSSVTISLAT